jgi:hypothetical protein
MVVAWESVSSSAAEMISGLLERSVMFTASGSGGGGAALGVELGENQLAVARHLPVRPMAVQAFCDAALTGTASDVEPIGACHGMVSLGTPLL